MTNFSILMKDGPFQSVEGSPVEGNLSLLTSTVMNLFITHLTKVDKSMEPPRVTQIITKGILYCFCEEVILYSNAVFSWYGQKKKSKATKETIWAYREQFMLSVTVASSVVFTIFTVPFLQIMTLLVISMSHSAQGH